MPVCTLLQTDNQASTPPLSFLQAGCPSCRPTNSVKALKTRKEETEAEWPVEWESASMQPAPSVRTWARPSGTCWSDEGCHVPPANAPDPFAPTSTSGYSTGSQRTHRRCPLANKLEYTDHRGVSTNPARQFSRRFPVDSSRFFFNFK